MSDKNKNVRKQEQNISDVLDMLKKSYSEENSALGGQAYKQEQYSDNIGAMSEEELKAKLRSEFIKSSSLIDADTDLESDNAYSIDESFFENTVVNESIVKEASEEIEEAALEEAQEAYVDEVTDKAKLNENIEKIEEIEDIEDVQEFEAVEDDEEKIYNAESSFDDISEDELSFDNDNPITNDKIDLSIQETISEALVKEAVQEESEGKEELFDDDITFDEIAETFDEKSDIEMMTLDMDEIDKNEIESRVAEDNTVVYRTISTAKLASIEETAYENAIDDYSDAIEPTEDNSDDNVDLEDTYDLNILDDIDYENTQADSEFDSSEISLLMQFGCDDEVVEQFTKDNSQDVNNISNEEADNAAIDEITEVKEQPKIDEKSKLLYKKLLRKKKVHFIGSIYMAVIAVLLIAYEGLPMLGINFPGIMNREEYYISYLLLGLQIVLFCAIPCFKYIADGTKRLFALHPDGYSVAVILGICTVIYDIIAIFSSDDVLPPTFHFALSCVLIFVYVLDLREVISDIKNFEFFYGESIKMSVRGNDLHIENISKYTLYKSCGKHSTAEKMYSGGIDSDKNIYFPIEANSVSGFTNIINSKSGNNEFSIFIFILSASLSVIIGIIALILSSRIYIGVSSALVSLFITMPIVFLQLRHLPYECIVARAQKEDYSFACEDFLDEFSESDILIFKDLHLFKKASPTGIKLALYDSTPKYALLGCLNAVYSRIGGPMADVFAGGDDKRFNQCNIIRVGKNGVQAVVGSNYSVLIGNEQFMARYGITFPDARLAREEDKAFTLCVSINGRASARFAVKYVVNDMFYTFADRLSEVNISCAVETFDPIISTQMLSQLIPKESTPISIVHLNAHDLKERNGDKKAAVLFEAAGAEAGVLARTSKLNLAVALRTAKQTEKLKKLISVLSAVCSGVCTAVLLLLICLGAFEMINTLPIVMYWLLSIGVPIGIIFNLLPSKRAFLDDGYSKNKKQGK